MLETGALCGVCIAIGLVIGYEWGEHKSKRREAPAPIIPDYDPNNPMNGHVKRETVYICGREWELRQP